MDNDRLKHSFAVAKKMMDIAKEYNLSEEDINKCFIIGINHDIGYEFTTNGINHNKIGGELLRDNGFTFEEKKECLRKFNEFINSIDTNKIDIFWTKSNLYGKLYDVFYYVEENMTDDELNELERKIDECDCFPVAGLTSHYWKHRKKYQMKVHPENIKLYTNYKIWRRYFKE